MAVETTPRFDLDGKTVLVTGASRGIGRACALGCAGSGADVIVGVRKSDDGKALTAEIEGLGRRALAVEMDLTDLSGMREAVAKAHKAFGRIDVLVNNAGNFYAGFFEELSPEDFRAQVETNLFGPANVTRAVLRAARDACAAPRVRGASEPAWTKMLALRLSSGARPVSAAGLPRTPARSRAW